MKNEKIIVTSVAVGYFVTFYYIVFVGKHYIMPLYYMMYEGVSTVYPHYYEFPEVVVIATAVGIVVGIFIYGLMEILAKIKISQQKRSGRNSASNSKGLPQ